MASELENLMQGFMGGGNTPAAQQAVQDHVNSTDPNQLQQQVQTAANNASQNGDQGLANQLRDLASRGQSNPQSLVSEATTLIASNPSILQHFEPGFARGILDRFQSNQGGS